MFTVNTQIPTLVRAQIRSLVKAHSDWKAFITVRGIVSATAKNAEILEFALMHPALAAAVDAILSANPVGPGNPASSPQSVDPDDFVENETAAETAKAVAEAVEPPAMDTAAGAYDFDALLGGVDQFLSPFVKAEIAKAFAPVIDAANQGPVERIVEVEKIIEVEPGQAPRIVAAKARRGKVSTFRTLFPSRHKDVWRDNQVTIWQGAAAPSVDPQYVVNHEQMGLLLSAIELGINTWVYGPAATGKTTIGEQAAAVTGRPFVKFGMRKQIDLETLVGGMEFRNGQTVWIDGALVSAMRQPGTIILFDELTFAAPGVQALIQAIADNHRSLTLPTGEVVKAADGVVFMVADNTNGSGDEGGLYAGTNVSNAALVTRFPWMLAMDYLTPQQEAEALANHTACPLAAARHLADFAERARRLPQLAGVVISLRQMVGFIKAVQQGFPVKTAFEIALSSRMPAAERAAIDALADLSFQTTFHDLVHGKASQGPAIAPSNSKASQAFAPGSPGNSY